ncbi:Rv2629 family ribosome hibernation factor [Mycobacterium sp. URHB0021]|jgi:peptide chain release factor subunit 1
MQPERFRPLADADGPFASVYFDDSHDTEDAAAQLQVRWKDIASELERQGADADLTSAVQRAALERAPAVGRSGRGVIAGRGVLLSGRLARSPEMSEIRVSDLPYLIPMVADGVADDTYVTAVVDHAGADITVHRGGHDRTTAVDGGGYPVHKASGAETPGYGDPQRRAEEAGRKNLRAAAAEVTSAIDDTAPVALFVVGEIASCSHFTEMLPRRVADLVVEVHAGARHSVDHEALQAEITDHLARLRHQVVDEAVRIFRAETGRESGLATEGLPGVCAALREGAVETLIIGDLGDSTVVLGDSRTHIGPNANVLSELGSTSAHIVRADEALPLAAVAIDAALVRADDATQPRDGIAAVLRYAPRTAASDRV